MAVTPGRYSVTAQTVASSYETIFEATAPSGSGSNGAPVHIMTFHAAGEAITVEVTRFGGQVSEMLVPASADRQAAGVPGPIVKVRAKSATGTGTLVWDHTM